MSFVSTYSKFVRYIKKEFNRNTLIFAIFFCIASLFWIINALNKSYTLQIPIQMAYSHIPKTKALITSTPDIVTVHVSATGFALLTFYMYSSKSIDVNIEQLLQQKTTQDSLLTIHFLPTILNSEVFPQSVQVQKVLPQYITCAFAPVSKKKVKVIANHDIECLQQYQLIQQPTVIPDSIYIYGAQQVLNNIDSVYTTKIYARQLAESFTRKIVMQSIKNVTFSDTLVTVKAEIEKFTEQQFSIPIEAVNIPDSIIIDLMTHKVQITMFTGMSHIQHNSVSDFKIIADYAKQNTQTGEIPVEIVKRPKWGRVVKISPEFVGYIIDTK